LLKKVHSYFTDATEISSHKLGELFAYFTPISGCLYALCFRVIGAMRDRQTDGQARPVMRPIRTAA